MGTLPDGRKEREVVEQSFLIRPPDIFPASLLKMKTKKQAGWGALARGLEVSRRSLLNWRRLPGAPETPDLKPWRTFVEENSLGIAPNRITPARARLMEENLSKRNHLLDLEIAKQENRMIEAAAVNEFLGRVGATQKTVFYAMLEGELPPRLVGKTQPEMTIIGRETADKLCDIFSTELDRWLSALPKPKAVKPCTAG
jgi:hypothetical protein